MRDISEIGRDGARSHLGLQLDLVLVADDVTVDLPVERLHVVVQLVHERLTATREQRWRWVVVKGVVGGGWWKREGHEEEVIEEVVGGGGGGGGGSGGGGGDGGGGGGVGVGIGGGIGGGVTA